MSDKDSQFRLLEEIRAGDKYGEVNVVSLLMERFHLSANEARQVISDWVHWRAYGQH